MDEKPLQIDIVSDVVCPWCVIGYFQLKRALERTGTTAEIRWRPFELNPNMAAEGENLREHLAAKYGTTPEGSREARAKLTALGAELGFAFDYADDMRMYNTFQAHQLLHWAREHGAEHALKIALFGAFFTHRRDVSDVDVLAQAAAEVGLDAAEARRVLDDARFAAKVRTEQRHWIQRGVQGVPAMVFDERAALVGAHGVKGYAELLMRLKAAA